MDPFKGAMQAFLDDETFSDLTIICGTTGREFKAHRVLVSAHSKWFMRCCAGSFAEAQHRRVELKDDQPEALERMIQYFYQFTYDEEPKEIASELELHAWMLVISDKYEVSKLSERAQHRFQQKVSNPEIQPDVLIAAATIIYENLPYKFITTDLSAEKTPHELLADAWIERGSTLVSGEGAAQVLQSLLKKAPAFAVHVQSRMLCNLESDYVLTCPHCKHQWAIDKRPSMLEIISCPGCEERAWDWRRVFKPFRKLRSLSDQ